MTWLLEGRAVELRSCRSRRPRRSCGQLAGWPAGQAPTSNIRVAVRKIAA